jgi:hypothetical protein
MVTLSADMSPRIEQMQIERLRQMPAWRKLLLEPELAARVYGPAPEET